MENTKDNRMNVNSVASIMAQASQPAVANAFLGNPSQLEALWERDGYLYFQQVIDPELVDTIRREYASALYERGLVDDPAAEPVWNGTDRKRLPNSKLPEIANTDCWRSFINSPSVNAVLRDVLQDEPFWLPMTEYRAVLRTDEEMHFLGLHQDALQNSGMSFRGVWVPLNDIDETMGGLALAEGWHRRGFVHDDHSGRLPLISSRVVTPADWRRAHYRPGDLVVFDDMIPHGGVSNHSDRIRLSMDLRVMGASAPRPVIGQIVAVKPGEVLVETREGAIETLSVHSESRLRLAHGIPVAVEDLVDKFPIGMPVVASHEKGRTIMMRDATSY